MRPFPRRRFPPPPHKSTGDDASVRPTEAAVDGDDRPSEQTLHVRNLLERGFTLTEVSTITAVPDALVQLIAEELAEAPWGRAPRSTDAAP